jgi:hypothetical protein
VATPSLRRLLRHWLSAIGIEATTFTSSSLTPLLTISWKRIGLNRSPMIFRPEAGSRWWTSATRPAIEFSIGIMPSSQTPVLMASNASSKVAQG